MRPHAFIATAFSFFATLAVTVCLCSTTAAAQVADANLTVEQARAAFSNVGFQVDRPLSWAWTSSPVTTFQIHDPARARVLMVFVYSSAEAAQNERRNAQARENSGAIGAEPHLVPGYGPSIWRGNLALVQTSQSELDRLFQLQNDRDNCVLVDSEIVTEPANYAVDLDVQQALDRSVLVNL